MPLISPPELASPESRLIFLAGPIQGADMWQARAADLILAAAPELTVASPRRAVIPEVVGIFEEQVDWETHHLRQAGRAGVVLFWLAREAEHRCDRAYAQTTRFELAEWKLRHERDGARIAVGIEDGFTGAAYIRRRFVQDCPLLPLWDGLEATCANAVALAREIG